MLLELEPTGECSGLFDAHNDVGACDLIVRSAKPIASVSGVVKEVGGAAEYALELSGRVENRFPMLAAIAIEPGRPIRARRVDHHDVGQETLPIEHRP